MNLSDITIKPRCLVINEGDWVEVGSTRRSCYVFRDGRWAAGDGSETGFYQALSIHSNEGDVWDVWPPESRLELKYPSQYPDAHHGVKWIADRDTDIRVYSFNELERYQPEVA